MCAIWGFSLVEGSEVKSRVLANALASEGEIRGTDSSGWAFATRLGGSGIYKDHVKGVNLPMKGLPRKADAVIGHNRFATQGTHLDNSNNHPQVSPEGHITLTHNGHISNDWELRKILTNGSSLATVDTSVIPAVLEEFGTEGTGLLSGYAAVTWLDDRTGNTVHLARLDTSPVSIARLLDGSIVFASTDDILARALKRAGLKWVGSYPKTFMELSDGDYITITDGVVSMKDKLDWYDDYYYTGYSSYGWKSVANASQSGASYTERGTTVPIAQRGSEALVSPMFSYAEDGYDAEQAGGFFHYEKDRFGIYKGYRISKDAFGNEGYFNDDKQWFYLSAELNKALADGEFEGQFDEDGYWTDNDKVARKALPAPESDQFFAVDHDGDYQSFRTFEVLASYLKWNGEASLGADASWNLLTEDKDISWVNIVSDLGAVDDEGNLFSFAENPEMLEEFEGGLTDISFIKAGLSVLANKMVKS